MAARAAGLVVMAPWLIRGSGIDSMSLMGRLLCNPKCNPTARQRPSAHVTVDRAQVLTRLPRKRDRQRVSAVVMMPIGLLIQRLRVRVPPPELPEAFARRSLLVDVVPRAELNRARTTSRRTRPCGHSRLECRGTSV